MDTPTLQVRIITPKKTLFEGEAFAVSSKNSNGKFDILPRHTNFITYIEKNPIEVRSQDKQVTKYNFNQAIIYASQDKVNIYAEPQQLIAENEENKLIK